MYCESNLFYLCIMAVQIFINYDIFILTTFSFTEKLLIVLKIHTSFNFQINIYSFTYVSIY